MHLGISGYIDIWRCRRLNWLLFSAGAVGAEFLREAIANAVPHAPSAVLADLLHRAAVVAGTISRSLRYPIIVNPFKVFAIKRHWPRLLIPNARLVLGAYGTA